MLKGTESAKQSQFLHSNEITYLHKQAKSQLRWVKRSRKDNNHTILNNSVLRLTTTESNKRLFTIQKKSTLGEGSYGKVKLGIDLHTGEKVAIKIGANNTEVKILSALNYLIASGKRIAQNKNAKAGSRTRLTKSYVVMKLIPGKTLKNAIHEISRFPKDRLNLAIAIAEAVNSLHQQKISHGDLQINNIIINPDLTNVTLIDFGYGKIWKNLSSEQISYYKSKDLIELSNVFKYHFSYYIPNVNKLCDGLNNNQISIEDCIHYLKRARDGRQASSTLQFDNFKATKRKTSLRQELELMKETNKSATKNKVQMR